ncbi:MAG TPA: 2-oxoacid:acceptor oxidoreductase family protein [Usitatibacteraceae bacterium]|nr:2-oxoacid:acceptor oxidoreductase family protein [Usitatibacteraceae bacterium]
MNGSLPTRVRFNRIRFESIGGLGADSAAHALAATTVEKKGLDAAHLPSGGLERKGSRVRSEVLLASSDRPIRDGASGGAPDAIVVFHAALLRDPRTFAGLRKDGTFIYNAPAKSIPEELAALPRTARVLRIDAAGIAAKEKCAMNAVLLGALCGALPYVDAEAVLEGFCADEPGRNGFRRGMKEPETLADVGEADGDLSLSLGSRPGTGSAGGILSDPGTTVWNDVSAARTGFIPAFNRERCIHCGLCDLFCPDSCLVWEKGEEGGRFERELSGVDYRYCKGCLRCVESCPASAMLKKAETPAFVEQRSVPMFPEIVE